MIERPDEIDPIRAARLLDDWGFLVHPDLPDGPGPAYLLVAVRSRPTLCHYDPELVELWVSDELGRGQRETITCASHMPRRLDYSWGGITLVDRLGVSNQYLTFGGDLQAERIDGDVYCVFRSPAPILRRGGHSQGWDTGSQNVGGFLGRFRAAAGYERVFEQLAAAADPVTRYAAFVGELTTRYRRSGYLRDRYPRLWTMMLVEERRLRRDHPGAWAGGARLIEESRQAASGHHLVLPG